MSTPGEPAAPSNSSGPAGPGPSGSGPDAPIEAEIVDVAPAAPSYEQVTGFTPAGVPTFDHVREVIERRTATALGSEELAHETAAGQDVERRFAEREKAAKAKLDEIRRSLGSPTAPPAEPEA